MKFIGNNAEQVTGSIILLEYDNIQVLIDVGLEQGSGSIVDFKKNSKLNNQIAPSKIDYIIATHLNIDHIGKIPFMYKYGFKGINITVKHTKTIAKNLWRDSFNITNNIAKLLNKYDSTDKYEALYDMQHIDMTLDNMTELDFYEEYHLGSDMYLYYNKAGHIFQSGTVIIEFRDTHRRMAVSGDLGSTKIPYHFVDDRDKLLNTNIFIGEATYCRPTNKILTPQSDREDLIRNVKETIKSGKSVVIPSFALQRSQEILAVLYDGLHDWNYNNYNVYLDSPLAANVYNEFRRHYQGVRDIDNWNRFSIVSSSNKSKNICRNIDRPSITVCASGMGIDYTRSSHHIQSILGKEGHLIIKIGYAPPTVPLGKIFSEESKVKIMDNVITKKCNLIEYNSFSSHIQYNEILDTYSDIIASNGVYLVHGEADYKDELADKLNEISDNKCNSTKYISVNRNDTIIF